MASQLDEKEEKIMHFKAKINRKTGFHTSMLLAIMMILSACTARDLERIFGEGQMPEGQSSASADPVIEQFEANPPGAMAGDTSTLRWRTRNTVSVNISGIGNVPSNGEQEVNPGRSYKLTATGSSGKSVSEERFIAVYQPKIIGQIPIIEKFEANPPHVTQGGTTTLQWRTRNTASATISGIGEVPATGSRVITVGEKGTYLLTATGHDGSSVDRSIDVGLYTIIGKLPDLKKPDPQLDKKPPQSLYEQPAIKPGRVIKPIKPVGTLSIQTLSPPAQRSPANGKRFNHYPRQMTLNWNAVPGSAAYTVEIDCYGCCQTGKWCADIGKNYIEVQSISSTTYTFNFVGAQPGRWRVWAVDQKGNPGKKSSWWTFSFTR
jgi:hypothetical protein